MSPSIECRRHPGGFVIGAPVLAAGLLIGLGPAAAGPGELAAEEELMASSTASSSVAPAASSTAALAITEVTPADVAPAEQVAAEAEARDHEAPDEISEPKPAPRHRFLAKSKHPVFGFEAGGMPILIEARAQVKVRSELVGPFNLSNDRATFFVAQRARLGTTVTAGAHLRVFADVQDVRVWGSEIAVPGGPGEPTLFGYNANGIDFHQGYVGINWTDFDLRIGRQEIAFDGQRLIGAVDWTMQGRSFDAVRLVFNTGAHVLNGFAAITQNQNFSPTDAPHSGIGGLHYLWKSSPALKLAPSVFLDFRGSTPRWTAGARANGVVNSLFYDGEAYYQGVNQNSQTTAAMLLALRLGYVIDKGTKTKVSVFADYVSGDTDTTSSSGLSPFDTLYATNHKFYGFSDLFLVLPAHTAGRGLTDVGFTATTVRGKLTARLDLHMMMAADFEAEHMYGFEPDLVVGYRLYSVFSVHLGASVFVPVGDGLGRGSNARPWTYLQFNAAL